MVVVVVGEVVVGYFCRVGCLGHTSSGLNETKLARLCVSWDLGPSPLPTQLCNSDAHPTFLTIQHHCHSLYTSSSHPPPPAPPPPSPDRMIMSDITELRLSQSGGQNIRRSNLYSLRSSLLFSKYIFEQLFEIQSTDKCS